jgi:RNA polymerase sigma factor (sigma-70 family)
MPSLMNKQFNNDEQLFQSIMDHDEQAIRQYHDDITPRLSGYAYKWIRHKEDAADIATDAFVTTLKSEVEFKKLSEMTGYMYNNVRFKCLDYLKRNLPPQHVSIDELESVIASDKNLEEDLARTEFFKAVQASINKLNDKERKILKMYLEGYNSVEIGEVLGCSDAVVRSTYARALQKIRIDLINKQIIIVLIFFLSLNSSI